MSPPSSPTTSTSTHRPELLAPAGNWDCAKAAVENGADAIYFGLGQFNARMRANNFTEADLPDLMAFLHRRGVKGYVTFNTLIFPQELPAAEQTLRTIIAAGVDASIVQDVGICRLIRHLSPDFPIHASTQMTVTSTAGVEFARQLSCQLVVLARECSTKEINKIQTQLTEQDAALPLEVFVHGALCVAYSGQCLTSESLGGRSANRGECAQACRMPYDLIVDGEELDLGDRKYLLSPQDLAGLEVLPDLIDAGVTSLKIEGRLKTPEYVANVTRVYRQALDQAMEKALVQTLDSEEDTYSRGPLNPPILGDFESQNPPKLGGRGASRYNLEMAFSRGLYTGWFRGISNQELVHARFGKKRGVYLGQVERIQPGRNPKVVLKLEAPLKPGDGVVFDCGHPERSEEGGRVYEIEQRGQQTALSFGRNDLNWSRIHGGDRLWKTSDPELDKQLRQSFVGDKPQFQRPIHIEVHGSAGEVLTAISRDNLGHIVQTESTMPLVEAHTKPLTTERLQAQLSRLGNTSFRLGDFTNQLEGNAMLPVSELNRMRRSLVEQLDAARSQPQRWKLDSAAYYQTLLPELDASPDIQPELIVLIHHLSQLEAALEVQATTLYCEFEDPRAYREAVQTFRRHQTQSQTGADQTIWVAPPRITKPLENYILQQVRRSEADGYLVRNYDHLKFFEDDRCIGDFSLNVANPITANYFKQQFGLERLTASYDLNIQQLEDLMSSAPPHWFDVTVHQHMPMFHMEHCVFCAFLSQGTDYTNCGRPCETHEVRLRDRVGTEHVLQADAGCRNTVFNGTAQTGAEYVQRLLGLGVRHFRLDFLNETPEQVRQTIDHYQRLLQGDITGNQLWRTLQLQNQLGVTRGPLENA